MQKTLYLLIVLISVGQVYGQESHSFSDNFLQQAAKKYGLSAEDIAGYSISDNYVDKKTGVRHIYLQQAYEEIKIYNAILTLHISSDGKLVHSTSRFVSNVSDRILSNKSTLSPQQALQDAAIHLNLSPPTDIQMKKPGMMSKAGISENDIPYHLIYQINSDGNLVLCWNLVIKEIESANWWDIRVNASTGEVVDKTNWTISCNWDHGGFENSNAHLCTHTHHNHEESNTQKGQLLLQNPDSYNVYPIGVESPNHGSRNIVTNPANATASPFGWHDTDGTSGAEFTITRGNNVHAYEDRSNTNTPGFSPDGGASLDFDFPIDFGQSLQNSESAIITNLFFWNNIMHDVWYHYGFDEVSGNFQSNNYGKGGAQNDYVLAEAQDGSGTNNANFSTPPDGGSGRMQMYFWNSGSPNLTINSPMGIPLNDGVVTANFGPSAFNVTADLVLVNDGSGAPTEGCNAYTGTPYAGKIALIDRGGCEFGVKALNAENAGAVAVIVCNNVAGAPFTMGPGAVGNSVTIPSVMISQADCQELKSQLASPVNVTLEGVQNQYDSDLDNGIIAHEYGHGISIRLTGGPATSGCLNNQEQMGEGWSDWFGLMVTMNDGDMGTTGRGVGTYVLGETTNGNGIRPFPYSTDLGLNPHTYNAISGVSIPHGVGSVWCAMLWEMTWLLIEEYGFDADLYHGTGGNNMAMELVMQGLKLQPCRPGFVDGRDAILAADQLLYNGANECLIWEAFAKRGLGFSANQGSSASVSDGTEAFDLPPVCILATEKTVDKLVATSEDTLMYSIKVNNTSGSEKTNVIVTDSLPINTSYVAGSASHGGAFDGEAIIFPANTFAIDEMETYTFKVVINPGVDGSLYSTIEDAETITMAWTPSSTNMGLSNWDITSTNPYAGSSVWFAPDVPSPNEQYLTITDPIIPTHGTVLSFWHSYDTEEHWDGGLLQISTDNKSSWEDLGAYFSQNGYNDYIDNNSNIPAFSGTSGGYIQSVVDLSAFAGQGVYIRFWMHCDPAEGGVGWYIDDITINNIAVSIPNTVNVQGNGFTAFDVTLATPTRVTNCENLISLMDPIVSLTEEYRANIQIHAFSSITGNSNISLTAGENLEFNTGFEIELGSALIAEIGDCEEISVPAKTKIESHKSDMQESEN